MLTGRTWDQLKTQSTRQKMISDTLVSSCHADVHVHFFSLNLICFHLKLEKEREMS